MSDKSEGFEPRESDIQLSSLGRSENDWQTELMEHGANMSVWVHDRVDQLPALASQTSMIQNVLFREFKEIERVEFTFNRKITATDQTRYEITGITLTAFGVGLEGLNGRLEEWMELNNVNDCGNVRLQVTESAITIIFKTLCSKGTEVFEPDKSSI